MKAALQTLLAIAALSLFSEASAQIQDDESSASLLAMQCSMSSGRPPSQYEEYCRKLAKAVGLLQPKQQERVFGYLPRPTVVASGDFNGYGNTQHASGESEETKTNPLVALVGEFNESLISGDSTAAIIGGDPPESAASELDSGASELDSGDNEWGNWWGGFLGWLGEKVEELKEAKNSRS
ncbi:MAG: hypothetical protein P1U85_15180 [Verrucomicrobiales bacterium]|nr:hypothetical protein [Verrucomicrobiales bacterium]